MLSNAGRTSVDTSICGAEKTHGLRNATRTIIVNARKKVMIVLVLCEKEVKQRAKAIK